MVLLLLEHAADVDCRAKNGLTPLHLAAQEDGVPVAEILVQYKAEIDPQTKVDLHYNVFLPLLIIFTVIHVFLRYPCLFIILSLFMFFNLFMIFTII